CSSVVFTDDTASNMPDLIDSTYAVALGDVDGDGDLDAFVGNGFGQQNRLYLNGGTGTFTDVTATNLPALPGITSAVALGDVDGDGDLDAFVGNYGQQSRLFVNGGSGVFTDVTSTNLPALLDFTAAVALGDVDGDGDLDVFIGNGASPGQQNRLYLNGGSGVFTDVTAANLPALLESTFAVALGDVDGDGDLDAFVGNDGPLSRLYLNGGTGLFTDVTATNLPALLDNTRAVALGDVDGDGDLDAFVGNYYGQPCRLYLNSGTGVFTDVTATNLPALVDPTRAVALGDVDGDSDLDAFVGNEGPNRLYLNGGTGVFTDASATDLPGLIGSCTVAVSLGDVDGEGDLDAFVGNSVSPIGQQNRLYTNLTRQLAWRGIPRIGKPLALDLRGPPSGTWLLAASLASANLPLPPFGTLRLDPTTLFLVASGALDSQGRASLSFLVPSSPALVGVSVYWQAGVAPPALLTNLEITTATSL
ncbi:MAG: FG-GAP-like repeat-containing protein, partial [Actinobacteria bacterium]|nr:FG-GAP-like repeat-containing protein [Actinomycetota bacterium]